MKKIIAFGASNSKKSINQQLAVYTGQQIKDVELTIIDLNDYEMPLYSIDKEHDGGVPEKAHEFYRLIGEQDGIIVSFAEHNGNYTVAFKNVMDWASRIGKRVFQEKPMLLMSTSPGGRGGKGALEIAVKYLPFMGANVVSSFSLPRFKQHFSQEEGILDPESKDQFEMAVAGFQGALIEEVGK